MLTHIFIAQLQEDGVQFHFRHSSCGYGLQRYDFHQAPLYALKYCETLYTETKGYFLPSDLSKRPCAADISAASKTREITLRLLWRGNRGNAAFHIDINPRPDFSSTHERKLIKAALASSKMNAAVSSAACIHAATMYAMVKSNMRVADVSHKKLTKDSNSRARRKFSCVYALVK